MAVEIAPDNASFKDTLGWVHRANGDLDNAEASLRQAVEMDPQLAAAHYHLGVVLADLGRNDDAAASLRQALAVNPNFSQAEDARERLASL